MQRLCLGILIGLLFISQAKGLSMYIAPDESAENPGDGTRANPYTNATSIGLMCREVECDITVVSQFGQRAEYFPIYNYKNASFRIIEAVAWSGSILLENSTVHFYDFETQLLLGENGAIIQNCHIELHNCSAPLVWATLQNTVVASDACMMEVSISLYDSTFSSFADSIVAVTELQVFSNSTVNITDTPWIHSSSKVLLSGSEDEQPPEFYVTGASYSTHFDLQLNGSFSIVVESSTIHLLLGDVTGSISGNQSFHMINCIIPAIRNPFVFPVFSNVDSEGVGFFFLDINPDGRSVTVHEFEVSSHKSNIFNMNITGNCETTLEALAVQSQLVVVSDHTSEVDADVYITVSLDTQNRSSTFCNVADSNLSYLRGSATSLNFSNVSLLSDRDNEITVFETFYIRDSLLSGIVAANELDVDIIRMSEAAALSIISSRDLTLVVDDLSESNSLVLLVPMSITMELGEVLGEIHINAFQCSIIFRNELSMFGRVYFQMTGINPTVVLNSLVFNGLELDEAAFSFQVISNMTRVYVGGEVSISNSTFNAPLISTFCVGGTQNCPIIFTDSVTSVNPPFNIQLLDAYLFDFAITGLNLSNIHLNTPLIQSTLPCLIQNLTMSAEHVSTTDTPLFEFPELGVYSAIWDFHNVSMSQNYLIKATSLYAGTRASQSGYTVFRRFSCGEESVFHLFSIDLALIVLSNTEERMLSTSCGLLISGDAGLTAHFWKEVQLSIDEIPKLEITTYSGYTPPVGALIKCFGALEMVLYPGLHLLVDIPSVDWAASVIAGFDEITLIPYYYFQSTAHFELEFTDTTFPDAFLFSGAVLNFTDVTFDLGTPHSQPAIIAVEVIGVDIASDDICTCFTDVATTIQNNTYEFSYVDLIEGRTRVNVTVEYEIITEGDDICPFATCTSLFQATINSRALSGSLVSFANPEDSLIPTIDPNHAVMTYTDSLLIANLELEFNSSWTSKTGFTEFTVALSFLGLTYPTAILGRLTGCPGGSYANYDDESIFLSCDPCPMGTIQISQSFFGSSCFSYPENSVVYDGSLNEVNSKVVDVLAKSKIQFFTMSHISALQIQNTSRATLIVTDCAVQSHCSGQIFDPALTDGGLCSTDRTGTMCSYCSEYTNGLIYRDPLTAKCTQCLVGYQIVLATLLYIILICLAPFLLKLITKYAQNAFKRASVLLKILLTIIPILFLVNPDTTGGASSPFTSMLSPTSLIACWLGQGKTLFQPSLRSYGLKVGIGSIACSLVPFIASRLPFAKVQKAGLYLFEALAVYFSVTWLKMGSLMLTQTTIPFSSSEVISVLFLDPDNRGTPTHTILGVILIGATVLFMFYSYAKLNSGAQEGFVASGVNMDGLLVDMYCVFGRGFVAILAEQMQGHGWLLWQAFLVTCALLILHKRPYQHLNRVYSAVCLSVSLLAAISKVLISNSSDIPVLTIVLASLLLAFSFCIYASVPMFIGKELKNLKTITNPLAQIRAASIKKI